MSTSLRNKTCHNEKMPITLHWSLSSSDLLLYLYLNYFTATTTATWLSWNTRKSKPGLEYFAADLDLKIKGLKVPATEWDFFRDQMYKKRSNALINVTKLIIKEPYSQIKQIKIRPESCEHHGYIFPVVDKVMMSIWQTDISVLHAASAPPVVIQSNQ